MVTHHDFPVFLTFVVALNDKNPIENIKWFNKWDASESFPIKQEQISLLAPRTFAEKYIRIYCRNPEHVSSSKGNGSYLGLFLGAFGSNNLEKFLIKNARSCCKSTTRNSPS